MAKSSRSTALKTVTKRAPLTLGDLIAAAFDTVGAESRNVARILSSPDMTVATGKHFVFEA